MSENTNTTFTCELCGAEYPIADGIIFDGQRICPHCRDEHTLVCDRCGERIWDDEDYGENGLALCEDCYNDYYTRCRDCGRLIHSDYANYTDFDIGPYCDHCYSCLDDGRAIHDYYYKPAPVFHGSGPRYFGVELEIDGAGETDDNARNILDVGNCRSDNIYCKHDGSLDDGFEIVTHPMSLQYHMEEMPWEDVLYEAIDMGYTSHMAGTCGLHVHVSRAAFGDGETWQECCIARVLYIVEKFWDEFLKFSRRNISQLNQWARRYGYKDHPQSLMDSVKNQDSGRYMAINLENNDTIEFRLWRGTLKLNTLIATLQMVDRICEVAISLSDEQIQQLSWTTFVAGCCDHPQLVQYLKERRLYVNEPVDDIGGEV